jgi:nucleoside-diphosphate kinase
LDEKTLVLLKPDAIARGLAGEIIGRLEAKGLRLAAMKMIWMDEALAKRHYAAHEGKPFFQPTVDYVISLPIVAMVLEGPGVISAVRTVMGATDPAKAAPGTIRGDLALNISNNLMHGSDSPESARKEIALFFREDEIHSWSRPQEKYITGE